MPASTDNELILIGGHAGEEVTEYLAKAAGDEIGIVTLAIDYTDPYKYVSDKTEQFARFGCKVRHVRGKDDIEGLSLVLYAGGDQNLLASRLKSSGLHLELLNWWRRKEVILAGSSAGAMVLCGVMLEGRNDGSFEGIELTHGLGPLGACFVVPHWSEWTAPGWREELVKAHGGGYYIFGIDETTAMVWRAGHCRVIGEGKVYAFGRMTGEWGDGQEFEIARGF